VATRRTGISIDDLAALRFPSSPRISPDGRSVVYVEKRSNLQRNRYENDLVLVDLRSGRSRTLTPEETSDTDPQWMPDSRSIVFVSNRGDAANLWRISLDDDTPQALTRLRGALSSPRVSPDGHRIAYCHAPRTATQEMLAGGKEHPGPQFRHLTRLGYKLDGHGYFDDAWMHVYVLDLRTGRSRRLTSGRFHDSQPAWSPNGRSLAFVSNRIPRADVHVANSDIFVVAATGGTPRQVTRQRGMAFAPSWSPDGRTIACIGHTEFPDWVHHPGVMTVSARGGRLHELTRHADLYCANEIIGDTKDVPEGTAPQPLWSPNGKKLRFLGSQDGTANLYEIAADGGDVVQLSRGRHEISEFSQNDAGNRWALVRLDATSPGDIHVVEPTGRARTARRSASFVTGASTRRLTSINRAVIGRRTVHRPEAIRVASRDGHTIHGWVLHARGRKRRGPAVLMVHGGPYAAYGWSFFHEFQMLASAGYHVVYTNIRGSISYGEDYMRALLGNWGHVDFRDVTDVADWMERQPWVDGKRMAIAGGSYGGYMTNWAIGHTRRFKCAITQRSVVDIPSFYGSSDMGWDFEQEFGGHPWENHERFWRTSPVAFVERMHTPLLILHSDEDHRCPVSQAEELFVALRVLDRDVELVRFVGESHGLSRSGRPHNRLERLRRIHDWLDRKL